MPRSTPSPRFAPLSAAALALAAALLPACGSQGGRIDISQTTEAERESSRILPVGLVEFSDLAAQKLVRDLAEIPRIRDTDGPVTILIGSLDNKTERVSTSDFELAMSRFRGKLINSRTAEPRLAFVERRARMEDIAQRERVASDGFIAQPEDYNPQTTYALNGDFFRVGRGDTHQYYAEFQLVHFGSNQIVWLADYDLKQVKGD